MAPHMAVITGFLAGFEKRATQLHGGRAEGEPDNRYPKPELREGAHHELEHTNEKPVAKQIAKDHLEEDRHYYTHLGEAKLAFRLGFEKRAEGKAVACVALLHGGKILMGKRRDNLKFTNPGGHLNPGEAPLAGAVREVREESGISLHPDQLDHLDTKHVTKPDGAKLTVHAYKVELGGKPATSMTGDPDQEVHRWSWFPLHRLPSPLHVKREHNVLLNALLGHEKAAAYLTYADLARYAAEAKERRRASADAFHTELKRKLGQTKEAAPAPGTVAYSQKFIENLKARLGQT